MNWSEANQRFLMSALDAMRVALEGRAGTETRSEDTYATTEMSPPPALETLCKLFGL